MKSHGKNLFCVYGGFLFRAFSFFRITKNSNALNRLKPIQKDPSIIYDAKILIGHLNLMTLAVRLSLNIYINNQWFMI